MKSLITLGRCHAVGRLFEQSLNQRCLRVLPTVQYLPGWLVSPASVPLLSLGLQLIYTCLFAWPSTLTLNRLIFSSSSLSSSCVIVVVVVVVYFLRTKSSVLFVLHFETFLGSYFCMTAHNSLCYGFVTTTVKCLFSVIHIACDGCSRLATPSCDGRKTDKRQSPGVQAKLKEEISLFWETWTQL